MTEIALNDEVIAALEEGRPVTVYEIAGSWGTAENDHPDDVALYAPPSVWRFVAQILREGSLADRDTTARLIEEVLGKLHA